MLRGKSYAEYYDTHHGLVDTDIARDLPPLLTVMSWREKENILDHGCGTFRVGSRYLVPYAEKYDSKIYGLDICKGMIEYAKEKYPHPNVEYVQGTLLDEDYPRPLKDVKFDKIFSLYVLMSDPDYRKTLEKMYELLVRGGSIVLFVVVKTNLFDTIHYVKQQESWAHIADHLVKPDWFVGHENDYRPHFEEILSSIGFTVKSGETVPCKFKFANASDCAEFFISQNPVAHESKLEHDDHRAGAHDTFHEFLTSSTGIEKDEEYEIEYELINFLLEKPAAAAAN